MKLITKPGPPPDYARWCTATEDWNPSWGALEDDRPMRRLVVAALVAEQRGLCAYCNQRISDGKGHHHVEHLLPRRLSHHSATPTPEELERIEDSGIQRERLDIDYRNLLACCPNRTTRAEPMGCGDHKGDRLLVLTPLEPRCEQAFRYLLTGTIESDYGDGMQAIHVLGLDRADLTRARRDALEGWLLVLEQLDALPSDQRRTQLQRLLNHDPLPEFVVAARQLLTPPA